MSENSTDTVIIPNTEIAMAASVIQESLRVADAIQQRLFVVQSYLSAIASHIPFVEGDIKTLQDFGQGLSGLRKHLDLIEQNLKILESAAQDLGTGSYELVKAEARPGLDGTFVRAKATH